MGKKQFNLKKQKHLWYWIVPLVSVSLLVILNYSGISALQSFVAPLINREFGALEHLQLVVILGIIIVLIKGWSPKRQWLENVGYVILTLFFVVAFLEEIDYGLHYYEFWNDIKPEDKAVSRNLHNKDDNKYLYIVRQVIILTMILFLIILPLLKHKIKNYFIRHFCADKMIVATFVVYIVIGQMARLFPKWGMPINPSLFENHQEFEELVSYYMIFLFIYEITLIKKPLLPSKKI